VKGRRLHLKAQLDFVNRLSQSPTTIALEELIWNAFDERARTVSVKLDVNDLAGVDRIQIIDDGQSLEYSQAPAAFENLGRSNKLSRTLESGERLHGRKGEGRHKAFSLGHTVVWEFVYAHGPSLMSYGIEGTAGRADPFFLTVEKPAAQGQTVGCTVTITDIQRSLHRFLYPSARQDLASVFAPFLLRHVDRSLYLNDRPIRPKDAVVKHRRLRPFQVEHEGTPHRVAVEVIHWKPGQQRNEVFLCSSSGIPLHQILDRTLPATLDYSVYVRSDLFEHLHEENLLSTIESTNDGGRKKIVSKIRTAIRKYFRKLRQAEADATLNQLKQEGSYPFRHEPRSEIDKVERHVFDVCAINVSRHLPNFNEGMDVNGRKLLLRMIQEALTQNPTSVGKIIREVCKLPETEAKAFAQLLEDVPLSNVVHAASMVAERLSFLKFFEAVIYLDPFDRVIKERTELHRVLAMNTWLFGEEYAHGTDDENLKAILEKHIAILGRNHLQQEVAQTDLRALLTEFNRDRKHTPKSLDRIPDLMLWQCFRERRPDEYEFLVIEIKRPGGSGCALCC
jgi:hypothetical protein